MSKPYVSDYVEVAERLAEFLDRYPDGSLQMDPPQLLEINGEQVLWARAYAYRTPDDPRPGIGTCSEAYPGKTTFTRGSEIANLETSAWGRAMAALGIATKKGIATGHEVRAAKSRQESPVEVTDPISEAIVRAESVEQLDHLVAAIKESADPGKYRDLWARRHRELT